MKPDPQKLEVLIKIPPPNINNELQAFFGVINYLSKFSPSTANVCESLRQLTLNKTEWTWNATYQKLFEKTKSVIKEDACMKFYDEAQPVYLETDASGVGLGAALLQTRSGTSHPRDKALDNGTPRPVTFSSKSLSSLETRYTVTLKKDTRYTTQT